MIDKLGDKIKYYEQRESGKFMPLLPICARLDGKGFSKFTKGLTRPYDVRLSNLMKETTKYLVGQTNANIGYTQSDEISLVWYSPSVKTQVFYDGKMHKIVSILAAMCSTYFSSRLKKYLPEKEGQLSLFDCRAWTMPTLKEACDVFLWREIDATKNSISMAASEHYSHKYLLGKNSKEKQELLFEKGINWSDYPTFFKRGTFFQKRKKLIKFSTEELEKLPSKHNAHKNPDLTVLRSVVEEIEMPPFSKVINKKRVIFSGHGPITLG